MLELEDAFWGDVGGLDSPLVTIDFFEEVLEFNVVNDGDEGDPKYAGEYDGVEAKSPDVSVLLHVGFDILVV